MRATGWLILMVVPVVVFELALRVGRWKRALRASLSVDGRPVTGTIDKVTRDVETFTNRARIEYVIDGKTLTTYERWESHEYQPTVGDSIQLMCDPRNPKRVCVVGSDVPKEWNGRSVRIAQVVMMIVGVVAFLVTRVVA